MKPRYVLPVFSLCMALTMQPSFSQNLTLSKNISYLSARKQLLSQGWKPVIRGNTWNMDFNKEVDLRYRANGVGEFWGCNGIGNNICYFYFKNKTGTLLQVGVLGGTKPTLKSKVNGWSIVNSIQDFDF
jgi:hypothetical protein